MRRAYNVQSVGSTDPLVSSVFRDLRSRMPFVPALFRALADDPPTLEAAWLQARALYDDPLAAQAVRPLAAKAAPGLDYAPSPAVRAVVMPFREELPLLLLIVASLGLALDGVIPLRHPPSADLPEPGAVPETAVRELPGEHPLYPAIRAVYETQHVPVLFRALAARGLLEGAWDGVGPYLASPEGRLHAARLAAAAEDEARRLPDVACFRAQTARPVIDELRRALPRNLIFATACTARESFSE